MSPIPELASGDAALLSGLLHPVAWSLVVAISGAGGEQTPYACSFNPEKKQPTHTHWRSVLSSVAPCKTGGAEVSRGWRLRLASPPH